MVENAADIEYLLNWNSREPNVPVQRVLFNELSAEEKMVFENISKEGEMNIDMLCRLSGIPVFRLSAILLKLEFDGIIRCLPGNIYRLVL